LPISRMRVHPEAGSIIKNSTPIPSTKQHTILALHIIIITITITIVKLATIITMVIIKLTTIIEIIVIDSHQPATSNPSSRNRPAK